MSRHEREQQIAEMRDFIEEGLKGQPAGVANEAYFQSLRDRAKARAQEKEKASAVPARPSKPSP